MGTTTPNIGIYIPAAGETNYDAAFAAGMMNIDQHNHTGGPNNGVQLSGASIDAGAITFDKLNANVVDNTTGIFSYSVGNIGQLYLAALLASIYQIATTNGFIAKNGTNAAARTLTGTANQIAITNGDGTSANPVFSIPAAMVAPGSITSTTTLTATLGNITATNGDLVAATSGNSLFIAEGGSADCQGSVVLSSGVATVTTSGFTANTRIQLSRTGINASSKLGTLITVNPMVGVSFDINAVDPSTLSVTTGDASTVDWFLIKH